MRGSDIYRQLVQHLSQLGMGYPPNKDLEDILRSNFTPREAEIVIALPTGVIPLQPTGVDEIMSKVDLPRAEVHGVLETLVDKGLIFASITEDGRKGYALQQVGFGFPQAFFWKGEDTPHSRNMADLVAKYFNREVTREAYGTAETKPFRYIPLGKAIEQIIETVYPYHMMESIIQSAKIIAVSHCACRMIARLRGNGCDHPTEVCIKFDDMAEYLVDRGLARRIDTAEALTIIKRSEEAGLVHFVDNAQGSVKHNCNCCGCACWSLGSIKRRKIPRDVLMATYFLRVTEEDECTGCGECVEACPVDALQMAGNIVVVGKDWCIGCGICVDRCPTGAARLQFRPDKKDQKPEPDFKTLHEKILKEKRLQ